MMKRFFILACVFAALQAHDVITTKITWTREISRLVFNKCTSCHRDSGSAFSLTTYEDARPWAKAIKEEVLERRMPPFGAVKGFSELRGDQSLMQEQIELISAWVEGGAPEGDRALLPKDPNLNPAPTPEPRTGPEFVVDERTGRLVPVVRDVGKRTGRLVPVVRDSEETETLPRAMTFAGIKPKSLKEDGSVKVIAQAPDGAVTPLLWVYQFKSKFSRTYFFRQPLTFPPGTKIINFPPNCGDIALLPAIKAAPITSAPAEADQNTAVSSVSPPAAPGSSGAPLDYVCPMDPDVRADKPGKCPRCGMTLKLGISDESEYGLELTTPHTVRPGQPAELKFTFKNPSDNSVVKKFDIVHEKLFHMFIVSGDLQYFVHDHPVAQSDGTFTFTETFPKSGMYRIVADVYPSGGTPQLLPKTVFVSSGASDAMPLGGVELKPDLAIQHGANTDVELVTDPVKPIAGAKTHLWFKFNTADRMQKYLGAWAHMLIASDDTIDLIHEHPFIADGGSQMQFDVIFPRAHTYRVWVQFQRNDVVNTVAVNIPVVTLEQATGFTSADR